MEGRELRRLSRASRGTLCPHHRPLHPPPDCLRTSVGAGQHLAVGDGIEHLADLGRGVDLVGRGGQWVRGDQCIHGHHTIHIIRHDEVFLQIPNSQSGDWPRRG